MTTPAAHVPCPVCGFGLHLPLAALEVSDVGLYDDGRYPGRMIVTARRHWVHLDEVEPAELAALMADAQRVARALRQLPGVTRTNVAILGNREPHVHVHVIPRRATDAHPDRAPWDDAPPWRPVPVEDLVVLQRTLVEMF